jgi:Ca2+-binding RTX toxin-like protein
LQIIGDSGANALAITPSGALTTVTATGYAPFVFSGNNYTALTLNGLDGADTLELIGLGTGQTNNMPINLNGGLGDDTLRVHSTSGQTGTVTLTGDAGNDLFILQSLTNTVDGIVAPIIVDGSDGLVANNDDRLVIVDTGDTTGDTVLISAVNPATSADYRIEGITSTAGNDVIFRNIDTLSYTGTQGNDLIDAQFVNTTPMHDLSVVTLNGWTGGDQFLLFTSDQIGGTAPTPSGTASGLAIINLNGDAPGNPNGGDGNDIFGQTPPGLVGTGAGNAGLVVADSVRLIRPSASTAINLNGGQPTAPVGTSGDIVGDVLNLDITSLPSSSGLVLATAAGVLASTGLQPLTYAQIEDLNVISGGELLNLQMGDTLVRGTSGPDTVIFSQINVPSNPNNTRVRLNNLFVDFPMSGKTLTFAGDSNDYLTHSNVTFPMESHGEGGDDYIAGGSGNDLLVGGLGHDQINAGAGNNIVIGDQMLSGTSLPQDSVIGGNDILSALGGNDVFYGGGGNDQVSPGAGNDYLYGGEGDDILDGNAGDDRIYGGNGDDVLSGSAGNDLLSGGDGDDILLGLDGNDVLIGGLGTDSLNGGNGDDLLISGSVANELSSWTSVPNTTTFDANLFSRPADNDAALLILLTQWSTTGNRSSLAAITDDGVLDAVWGNAGNDDFSTTPGEAQDLNATGMGVDELF